MNKIIRTIFAFSSAIIFSFAAQAGLGDRESSITADKKVLRAASVLTYTENYTVHEMATDGNVVKEYVSTDGVVFAVTWRGVKKPNLSVLLGTYFTEYSAAEKLRKKSKGRQPVSVKTSNVVVRRGGHMRDLHGMAFVAQLVPAGVNVEVLP